MAVARRSRHDSDATRSTTPRYGSFGAVVRDDCGLECLIVFSIF